MSSMFTNWTAVGAALALGCGAPPAPPDGTAPLPADDPPQDVSPWVYEPDDAEIPPVDPDALGRALDLAVGAILTEDARPVVDTYLDVYGTSATPDCPEVTGDGLGNLYWATGCLADDGTTFAGYLGHYTLDGTFDPDSGMFLTGTQLGGNIVLDGPGGILDLEGAATFITGISQDGTTALVVSSLVGGFYGPNAGGWLGDSDAARSVTNSLTGYTVPSVGGAVVIVDGSVVVDLDGELYSVVFRAAQLANVAIGSECGLEPGGSVDIRDPFGRWTEITFHGPILEVDGGDPTRCDGCGDAVVDGSPIDPVCGDFEPWFRWELLP